MYRTVLSCSVMGVAVLLGLLTSPALSQSSEDCIKYPNTCNDSQCCLMMAGTMEGRCAERLMENKTCEMVPQVHPSDDEVYMTMCPCDMGMSCAGNATGSKTGMCQTSNMSSTTDSSAYDDSVESIDVIYLQN